MNSKMYSLILILAFTLSGAASADPIIPEKTTPPLKFQIKKGTRVEVEQYDQTTDTFLIAVVREPDADHNYVKSTDFAKAIEFKGGAKVFLSQRAKISGSIYPLTSDLQLLSEEQMADLRKKHQEVQTATSTDP